MVLNKHVKQSGSRFFMFQFLVVLLLMKEVKSLSFGRELVPVIIHGFWQKVFGFCQ